MDGCMANALAILELRCERGMGSKSEALAEPAGILELRCEAMFP